MLRIDDFSAIAICRRFRCCTTRSSRPSYTFHARLQCVGDEIENATAVNGQIVGREGQGSAEVRWRVASDFSFFLWPPCPRCASRDVNKVSDVKLNRQEFHSTLMNDFKVTIDGSSVDAFNGLFCTFFTTHPAQKWKDSSIQRLRVAQCSLLVTRLIQSNTVIRNLLKYS